MATGKPNLLTTGQAAQLCSVTPDTVLKWIKKGWLRGVRTAGGHYRIERQNLEPVLPSSRSGDGPFGPFPDRDPKSLHCWEYLSDHGAIRDECRQCVVYRVRAARCFLMAGLEPDVGHARRFCQTSCEECVYYRRVKGLATNVLFITSDDNLIAELSGEQDERVALRFARNAYEASAIIPDFRPAFVAIDVERIPAADTELVNSLVADPRVPGLKIILVVPPGRRGRGHRQARNDLIVGVLEKPFATRRIAEFLNGIPVNSEVLEDSAVLDPSGKERQ